MILPIGLHFDTPNFGIGRRQICFERVRPVWGNNGSLSLEGVTQFAYDHDEACEIARQHERDFRGMILSEETVPIWHDDMPEIDGYYTLTEVELPTASKYAFHLVRFELARVGSFNDLKFESVLQGTVKDNDFTITESGAEPIHAPPLGHENYAPRHSTTVTRNVAYEGDLTVYRDVDFDTDRKWNCDPRNWFRGAAHISRRDPLFPQYGPISGTTLYDVELEDIEIGNGIVKFWVQPDALYTSFWDGTAWRDKPIFFVSEGSAITTWNKVAIRDNRPERCALIFEGGTTGSVKLQVAVQRGDRGISCLLTSDASTTLGVFDAALTDMTITSNRAVYTAADANGHKLMFASMLTFSSTAADGYIFKATTTRFDAFVGMELSGAPAGNDAASLALNYAAALREEVRTLSS